MFSKFNILMIGILIFPACQIQDKSDKALPNVQVVTGECFQDKSFDGQLKRLNTDREQTLKAIEQLIEQTGSRDPAAFVGNEQGKLLAKELYQIDEHIKSLQRQFDEEKKRELRDTITTRIQKREDELKDQFQISIDDPTTSIGAKEVIDHVFAERQATQKIAADAKLKADIENRLALAKQQAERLQAERLQQRQQAAPRVAETPRATTVKPVTWTRFQWDQWWQQHLKKHESHPWDCTVYLCRTNDVFWSRCADSLRQMFPKETIYFKNGAYKVIPKNPVTIYCGTNGWSFTPNAFHGAYCPYHK